MSVPTSGNRSAVTHVVSTASELGSSHADGPGRYWTVARDAEAEIERTKSRFRCTLRRVESVEQARAVIDECRRTYHDARHHCSAMVIGPRGDTRMSSDDGEPGGSAGAPMLQALVGAGVSDVVAVVTRWFGGTLLGVGGLTRAYGDAVRQALADAGSVERSRLTIVEVALDHADAGRVEAAVRGRGGVVMGGSYGANVTLTLAARDPDDLARRIADLTAGRAALRVTGTRWVDAEA